MIVICLNREKVKLLLNQPTFYFLFVNNFLSGNLLSNYTTIIDVTRRYYWIFGDDSCAQITTIVHVICFTNQRKRSYYRQVLTYLM